MRQAQHDVVARSALDALVAIVMAEGSAASRYLAGDALHRGPDAARNAADAVHHLALLHGRHPGVIEHAVSRTADPRARDLIENAANRFAEERGLLARLVVAVGPLPSTPQHADAETAVLAQHHAIDMLAQSDRNGCATGAALALITEWATIRPLLDSIAGRLGFDAAASRLADPQALRDTLGDVDFGMAAERAMQFGAQQIVAQHSGLWHLLEARALARNHY